MRSEVCGTCRFWQGNAEKEMGECRRRPPSLHIVQAMRLHQQVPEPTPMAAFPPTHATTWCGEHELDDVPEGDA